MNPKLHNLADLQENEALKAENERLKERYRMDVDPALYHFVVDRAEKAEAENAALKAELNVLAGANRGTVGHSVYSLQRDRIRELEERAEKAEARVAELEEFVTMRADERPAKPAALYPHDVERCSHPDCQAEWVVMGAKERAWLRKNRLKPTEETR